MFVALAAQESDELLHTAALIVLPVSVMAFVFWYVVLQMHIFILGIHWGISGQEHNTGLLFVPTPKFLLLIYDMFLVIRTKGPEHV